MPDFFNYIHPLIEWLRANPQWSFVITFAISMLESLAVVGSIVPGSVTMTAIGILAGSGVMGVEQTLIAATLGAMIGDNLSYAIGYYYRENLKQIWPFSRYPGWIDYGGDFFKKHGGKSVFLGRFIGPLRSLIPVIAGMMQMRQGLFFIANFLSAILWSIGHIMPGVLIGAAGSELSTEAATKLFLIVIAALVAIWLLSLMVKWVIIRVRLFFRKHLHEFWLLFKAHPILGFCFESITPEEEIDHYPTVILFCLSLLCLSIFLCLTLINIQGEWVKAIDIPMQFLMASFRTTGLDLFFTFCTQLTSLPTIFSVFGFFFIGLIVKKNFKALFYLLSLLFFSVLIPSLLSHWIIHPRPTGLLVTMSGSAFPHINLVMATSIYAIAILYVSNHSALITNTIWSFIFMVLSLSGLGAVYFGDYWLSDVLASYFIGLSIFLIHWLKFRKSHYKMNDNERLPFIVGAILILILGVSTVSTLWNTKKLTHNHALFYKLYFLKEAQWWNQQPPFLPYYKYNRLGHIIGLFNIQYSGNLDAFKNQLEKEGWELHKQSFFQGLLRHMDRQEEATMPLLSQLYLNKKPELVMTLKQEGTGIELVLRMWESNYFLDKDGSWIWIGSIEAIKDKKDSPLTQIELSPLTKLHLSEESFLIKKVPVPASKMKYTPQPIEPVIYLIKQQSYR